MSAIEYSIRRMTLPEQMLYIAGLMQTVLGAKPKAISQVRSAIHHWELAITAEGGEIGKDPIRPGRD